MILHNSKILLCHVAAPIWEKQGPMLKIERIAAIMNLTAIMQYRGNLKWSIIDGQGRAEEKIENYFFSSQ